MNFMSLLVMLSKKQDLARAIPFYAAAKACRFTKHANARLRVRFINFVGCYGA